MSVWLGILLALVPFSVHAEYLGDLSANPFNPNSLSNSYGAGNPFAPNGLKNPFSRAGNPFSNQSATNPFATNPPKLYDGQGQYRGELSVHPFRPDSIANPFGRFGNPYSADSLNNPYGAGNPYNADSPRNPYGSGWRIKGGDNQGQR